MNVDGPDCVLNVELLGDGEPVTLFAHGITGSTHELAPIAARVSGTRALMDFRGHGKSDAPPEDTGYDHPSMRRDLAFVADHSGARNVVALSMGAGATLNLLADEPDRFDRIVLISPASIDGPNRAAAGLFLELARRLENDPVDDVIAWSLGGAESLLERRPKWRDEIIARTRRMQRVGTSRALRAYVHGRPPLADASALGRVRAPVLILAHRGDLIHDVAIAERLGDLFPNATVKVWDEPLAMFDDPDALGDVVEDFLRG
ncbi:MAG: alpha/beta hydrolase [Actinobacteria bacterium]|nr:alpha/beta hydrolase [Actinomycetota bacterium]